MSTTLTVTSATLGSTPFDGTWESTTVGYSGPGTNDPGGAIAPNADVPPNTVQCVGRVHFLGVYYFILYMSGGTDPAFVSQVSTQLGAGAVTDYVLADATAYLPTGTTAYGGTNFSPSTGPCWLWEDNVTADFVDSEVTTVIFGIPGPDGLGDVTDPGAWQDSDGNIPPAQFNNVPANTNYPQNGDGRFWWTVDAHAPTVSNDPIKFIGDPNALVNSLVLQWSITQKATDGSSLVLSYSVDGGSTYTDTTIGPNIQHSDLVNGDIIIPLAPGDPAVPVAGVSLKVTSTGGTSNASATPWEVACAFSRNVTEGLTWDNPNPFNPINYNGELMDFSIPTDTLGNLRKRVMIRLGFSNQAANPPPGMTDLINDFIVSGQAYLYKRYKQLHTTRKFRWKVNPGQRFYSLKDSDQDNLRSNAASVPNPTMDPNARIEWAGIQDTRNVWYPLIEGIPPQLYTMITKPWRPARYQLRGCIEVYPMPDQTYYLWMEGHFGLLPFAADDDQTTIDSELVFLHALSNAKAHYGQGDANNIQAQANAYRLEIVAASHTTAHYVPGTIAVPPAVRPTLIQFENNVNSG